MPRQSEWELSQAEAATARECGLEPLCQTLLQLGHMDPNTPPAPVAKPPSMVSDAFTNPGYIRYALKTLLACLICYVFYSGTDWEGIHTCMLTCIIVANPSIGSSYQKMALRFGGAFFGAILALLMTIFVMPLAGQYRRTSPRAGATFPDGCPDCHRLRTFLLYRNPNGRHLRAGNA